MTNPALDIPNLLYLYADYMDAADFTAAASLFEHGCVVAGDREIRGAEAIAAMWEATVIVHDDGTLRTRHLVTNPRIALDDDGQSASCRSQWTVLQQVGDAPLSIVGSGRYHDEFRIIDGAWHFTRRDYARVDFWGDTSRHMTISADTGKG